MNKPSANLKVALFDSTVCIKISGRANFTCSLDFKKVVNGLFDRGYDHFILDLTDCVIMDSTFLGMLAGIGLRFHEQMKRPAADSVELLNPNERIRDLLENLGVSHLFRTVTAAEPEAREFRAVDVETSSNRAEMTRNSLEAHRTLMAINPDNIEKFKDVAEFLAEDLKKIESKSNGRP